MKFMCQNDQCGQGTNVEIIEYLINTFKDLNLSNKQRNNSLL